MKRGSAKAWAAGLVAMGVAAAASAWAWREGMKCERARAALGAKEREWRFAMTSSAATERDEAAALEKMLAENEQEIGRLWAASRLRKDAAVAPAAAAMRSEEAFFEIAGFVERLRERAARCGVALKEDERFGFSEFSNIGPDAARVAETQQQRELAEQVLEILFEAGPRELMGCGRGREVGPGARERRWDEETFEVDGRLTLAEPGTFEAISYGVSFVGRTPVLRKFLNRLAKVARPIAVRAVEVDPVEERGMSGAEEKSEPLVRSGWSRFTVVVEQVGLAAETMGEWSEGAELTGKESMVEETGWAEPATWANAGEWAYDVFTPPEVFYDPATNRLTATAPFAGRATAGIENVDTAGAGLELVRVETRPFRVQLVGFVGGPEDYRGVFEDVTTAETWLAGAGWRFEGAEVKVEMFAVERRTISWPESMVAPGLVAKARVRDERSGERLWLSSAERVSTSEPVAVVRSAVGAKEEREMSVGEEIAVSDEVFRLEKIEVGAGAVELRRLSGEEERDVKVRLVAAAGGHGP